MFQKLLTIIFSLTFFSSYPQDQNKLQQLRQKINESKNDAEKIEAYSQLADYYSLFKLNSQADSTLKKALIIAELSNDKDLVFKSLFSNNVSLVNPWNSKETFEQIINYIKKGIDYSQDLKRNDYVALAHIRLAGIYRKRNLYDDALQQTTLAVTALDNIKADSIQCILYIEIGDIFLGKDDAISAYKNYNNAFAIAYKFKNIPLQSEIYHHFSELYQSLENDDMAKKNLLASLDLDNKNNYKEGLLKDYLDLGRLTDDTDYTSKTFRLANELNSERYKEYSKRVMFAWYMVREKNSLKTLEYFNNNPSLQQYFKNQGIANSYWNMGNIYFYGGEFDSARHYYKVAEYELNKNYDDGIRLSIFTSLAETYMRSNKTELAKNYYEKAFDLCKAKNNVSSLTLVSESLSKIYEARSDFRKAFYYDKQADSCNIILNGKSAKDKVVLLEVERENKQRENDLVELQQKIDRQYNLQIMAITILLAGTFLLMLFVGMFPVSKITIRMLGYFAFISLFEFIVLLLDPFIIKLTDGEPLKIWGVKIVLIALLVPFQHFLEHNLIKFLSSQKLFTLRQRFSFKSSKALKQIEHSANNIETTGNNIEEDTAVL